MIEHEECYGQWNSNHSNDAPKEIVASESIVNEEEAEVHDTLDLSGQQNSENSRARYYDKKI